MSGGVSATTVAAATSAAAAATSAAVGVYSAVESGKAADKQYAAQQAAFSDEITAAITNAEWAIKDKEQAYLNNQELQDSMYNNAVDALWDGLDYNNQFETAKANVKNTLDVAMASNDIQGLLGTTKANIENIQAMTSIDVEYQMAMAKNSSSASRAKALADSVEYLSTAEAGLQLLDADANTVMETMRRVSEDIAIGTDEAAGQVLVSTANTLNSGGSSARKMQQTYIKADRIKAAKMQEQESALARVYGNMTKTAKETGARVSNALTTGAINAAKAQMDAITSSQRTIASGEANIQQLQDMFTVNSNKVLAATAASIKATNAYTDAQITKNIAQAVSEFDKYTSDYEADKLKRTQDYTYDQLMTTRSLEQSLITGINKGTATDMYNNAAKLAKFVEENPEYLAAKEQYGWGADLDAAVERTTSLLTRSDANRHITSSELQAYTQPGVKGITNIFDRSTYANQIEKSTTIATSTEGLWQYNSEEGD